MKFQMYMHKGYEKTDGIGKNNKSRFNQYKQRSLFAMPPKPRLQCMYCISQDYRRIYFTGYGKLRT
jgi:hypothetical protein